MDGLARRLFAIEGVTNVLVNGDWVTVSKRGDVGWAGVKREVERVLGDAN